MIHVRGNDELEHHGIKGQRWYIRRYQNEDGTLTEEGKKRYLDYAKKHSYQFDKDDKDYYNNSIIKSIVKHINDTDDELINSPNLHLGRIANSDEPIDTKRKYLYTNKWDREQYESYWEMLGLDTNKPISYYEYEPKGKIKVRNGKTVTQDILNKYGDKSINEFYNDYYKYSLDGGYKPHGKKEKWAKEYGTAMTEQVRDTLNKFSDDDSMLKEYAKKGYDAVVDPLDSSDIAAYPIIALNPSKSLKKKKETRWSDLYG